MGVCSTYADEPLVLTDVQGEYPLGLYIDILEDPQQQWTIDDVSSTEIAKRFTDSLDVTPNFGYTPSAYWLRLRIQNGAPNISKWWLEMGFQNMRILELYTPSPECMPADSAAPCPFDVRQTGHQFPFSSREITYPTYVFALDIPLEHSYTVYLRLVNDGTMLIPLTLWSQEAFTRKIQFQQLRFGIYYGILLIMAAYNLALFLTLRDPSYGYYVGFIVTYSCIQASVDGFSAQFLWPNLPILNRYAIPVFSSLALIAMLQFLRAFVGSKHRMPRLEAVLKMLLCYSSQENTHH
jgi:hypothetical protein